MLSQPKSMSEKVSDRLAQQHAITREILKVPDDSSTVQQSASRYPTRLESIRCRTTFKRRNICISNA
jgi:hypothetical protein